MFGAGFARRSAKRYRRKGLDPAATHLVEYAAAGGLDGATVLEIGGGVGDIGIELLRRGAAGATTLELSDSYDAEAGRLAREAGVADRVRRRIVDIAATPDEVAAADIVVLHRVVCCYPDYRRLLTAAADHCRGRLAFSRPPRNAVSRAMVATQNVAFAAIGKKYRAYVHPPAAMLEVLVGQGLRHGTTFPGRVWTVEGLYR
jgi:magnesium-protoporphyrin O-methyltransferase